MEVGKLFFDRKQLAYQTLVLLHLIGSIFTNTILNIIPVVNLADPMFLKLIFLKSTYHKHVYLWKRYKINVTFR